MKFWSGLVLAVVLSGCASKPYVTLDRAQSIDIQDDSGFFSIPKFKQDGDIIHPVSLVGGLYDANEASRKKLEDAGHLQTYGAIATFLGTVFLGAGLAGPEDSVVPNIGAAVGLNLLGLFFFHRSLETTKASAVEYNRPLQKLPLGRPSDSE